MTVCKFKINKREKIRIKDIYIKYQIGKKCDQFGTNLI